MRSGSGRRSGERGGSHDRLGGLVAQARSTRRSCGWRRGLAPVSWTPGLSGQCFVFPLLLERSGTEIAKRRMPSPPVREDLELIEELAARRGPFGGQLVDVETGRPIACATVAAVWWDQYPLGLKFYDAREAISGEDGRFEIPRLDIPLTKLSVGAPQLHFLAPGYLPPGYYTTPGEPASAAHIIRYRVTPPEGQPFV